MLLKNLTKVWISKYTATNDHGETPKTWAYKGTAFLNLQQDVNELDRKSTGEVDYEIINARTDQNYDIEKGNGISFIDISSLNDFQPEYIVRATPQVGDSRLYKLEKNNVKVQNQSQASL